MGISLRAGDVTIKLSDGLDRFVERAIHNSAPGMLERITARVEPVLADARAAWPVKTGKSRAGLDLDVLVDTDREKLRVRIVNTVDYAIFVRPSAYFGAATAWSRLVQKPMKRIHSELADELAAEIAKAVT